MSQRLRLPSAVRQHLFEDAEDAAQALAEDVSSRLASALEQRPAASLVVPGGKTPVAFLEALSWRELEWSRVRVCPSDERWVDSAHPDSNERLLRSHLLRNAAGSAQLLSLKTSAAAPEWALADCEARLGQLPRPLDVVVLGMGADGHIASLFPDAPEIAEALDTQATAAVAAIRTPASAVPRMSLSLRRLLDSRHILLLTAGAEKRSVMELAAASPGDRRWPVSFLFAQRQVPLSIYHSA